MANRFSKIAEDARQKTNEQLAGELAGLKPLSAEQLQELLPSKSDKEKLAKLMAIVTASTSHNQKVAALASNIDELGGVLVKVLGSMG